MLNGKPASHKMQNGYAVISRKWKKGDLVSLNLPMPVRRVKANEKVVADQGRVALQRGPLVYCAEWPDFPEGKVLNILLGDEEKLLPEYRPELLSGVTVITNQTNFTAIPYFAWANRGKGEMEVWITEKTSN
jgi:hypothetical protein